jgi:DNA-binding NtrC family response regulator
MTTRYITATRSNGHIKPLAKIEAEAIELAMERYKGNHSEVARRLKISRTTLYRKLGREGY